MDLKIGNIIKLKKGQKIEALNLPAVFFPVAETTYTDGRKEKSYFDFTRETGELEIGRLYQPGFDTSVFAGEYLITKIDSVGGGSDSHGHSHPYERRISAKRIIVENKEKIITNFTIRLLQRDIKDVEVVGTAKVETVYNFDMN